MVDDKLIEEVMNVLALRGVGEVRSYISAFEREFASVIESRYAIGANSGTSALYFALRALGIGAGDYVATVANSWITTVTAIRETGAACQFVDVCPETGVMAHALLESVISERTKAIIPVHMYGNPVDMEAICSIARARRIAVIEDACQGIGASFGGRPVGSWGNIGCFSFHVNKLVGAPADGGMIVTNSAELAKRLRHLSQPDWTIPLGPPQVRVPSRLPALAVPILRARLRNLDSEVANRRTQFERYRAGIATLADARLLHAPAGGRASFRTCVLVSPEAEPLRAAAGRLRRPLAPMYKESLDFVHYLSTGDADIRLPHTAFLISHQLVLPNGPDVTNQDIDDIVAALSASAGGLKRGARPGGSHAGGPRSERVGLPAIDITQRSI